MDMEKWTANETEEDRKMIWGHSLKKENHTLPFIKVKVGYGEIELPQNSHMWALVSGMLMYSLEEGLKNGIFHEAALKVKEDVTRDDFKDPEFLEKHKAALREVMEEKGPYYVIGKAMEANYQWEMDPFLQNREYEYLGRIQESDPDQRKL